MLIDVLFFIIAVLISLLLSVGVIFYLQRKQTFIEPILDKRCHPYSCLVCNYDLVGSIAINHFSCPECNTKTNFNEEDGAIARSLLKRGIVSLDLEKFVIYAKCGDSYSYKDTILAKDSITGLKLAKLIHGETVFIIRAECFPDDGNGIFVLPKEVVLSKATIDIGFEDGQIIAKR